MVVVAAGTRIHGGHKHKAGRIFHRETGTGDIDHSIFQWLPHDFQDTPVKFRQLIQKKDTIVSQADLSRLRESATSYHSDIRDRMMGRAKRTLYHQGGATSYLTGYGMDFSCFQGLMQGKGRQDRGETFRQHRLATSGRTYHDQIMSAGCGHLHRTLHVLLSPDIGEIAIKQLLAVVKLLTGINNRRPQCRFPLHKLQHLFDIRSSIHFQIVHHRSLTNVLLG